MIRAAKRNVPPLSGGTAAYFICARRAVNSAENARAAGPVRSQVVHILRHIIVQIVRNMWTRGARLLRQSHAIL
jgi:hypothetical protein